MKAHPIAEWRVAEDENMRGHDMEFATVGDGGIGDDRRAGLQADVTQRDCLPALKRDDDGMRDGGSVHDGKSLRSDGVAAEGSGAVKDASDGNGHAQGIVQIPQVPEMTFAQAWEYATKKLDDEACAPNADAECTSNVTVEDLLTNEAAIAALSQRWFQSNGIPFDFSIVRGLADINRRIARILESRGVQLDHVDRMPHHLPYKVVLKGIAAMQGRRLRDIEKAVNRKPQSEYRRRIMRQYRIAHYRGTYVGIDLETTGDDPLRGYIINTGWVTARLERGSAPCDERSYYSGLPGFYQERPIPFEYVHHITWQDVQDKQQFRDDRDLQSLVLSVLTAHPYMAHHAIFEHEWFLYCLDGYAEAFKNGEVLPIDTQEICRKLDEDVNDIPLNQRPAALENWAKRRGTLKDDEKEKHLGEADAKLMMRTVLAELERHGLVDDADGTVRADNTVRADGTVHTVDTVGAAGADATDGADSASSAEDASSVEGPIGVLGNA